MVIQGVIQRSSDPHLISSANGYVRRRAQRDLPNLRIIRLPTHTIIVEFPEEPALPPEKQAHQALQKFKATFCKNGWSIHTYRVIVGDAAKAHMDGLIATREAQLAKSPFFK